MKIPNVKLYCNPMNCLADEVSKQTHAPTDNVFTLCVSSGKLI